ncbi:NAD-binding protein [Mycena epipterygia]|nr:NAD-binding protein [Mycena epipterygia]
MSTIRIACVTGAAQGIGRAIALRLAADGCNVTIGDLPAKMALLEDLVDEIQNKFKVKSVAISVDVTDEGDVDNLITTTVQQLGGLDVMVANAGVATLGNILDTSVAELERVHAVNVKGTFSCYKAVPKAMIAQNRGGIIIGASSLAGKKGAGMCSVYGSSKFAVRALTQSTAVEWGKHRIRVNAYAPGATETPLLTDMGVVFGNLIGAPAQAYTEIMKGQAALGSIGTPEAIAGVVSFLASKDFEFMTGQTLSVDGGIWFD